MEREVRLAWKFWKQVIEVAMLRSRNIEVSLRCWARPIAMRDRRVWQHGIVAMSISGVLGGDWKFLHDEDLNGTRRT